MADKAELTADVKTLSSQLAKEFQKDKARVESEGRPFDANGWAMGKPDSHKYPAAPGFHAKGPLNEANFTNSSLNMSTQDLSATALGAAVFYALGYSSAPKLGVRSPGVLGFWVALPAALLGLTAALRGGYYRYLGFMDNGNLTRYPGYVEDNTPWFVKHSVSDRHFKVSPNFHLDTRLKQQNEDSSRLQ